MSGVATAKTPMTNLTKVNGYIRNQWETQAHEPFCVMWMTGSGDSELIHTLIYRPEGTVRTYNPGRLDERAGEEMAMPKFDNPIWALTWMRANRHYEDAKCLVTLRCAASLRDDDKFAEPV